MRRLECHIRLIKVEITGPTVIIYVTNGHAHRVSCWEWEVGSLISRDLLAAAQPRDPLGATIREKLVEIGRTA